MAPHLNLTPGDVKQMMEELQVLRELVVTLRKERDDTLALLATSDVRSHIEEEEDDDDDDSEMDVSPSTPPSPESDQAEPSTSVEEIVEPENGAPFIEVRYRKRHPSPHPEPQTSGPDREPPSEVPRKVKKTKLAQTPQVSQPTPNNPVPTPKVAGNQPPAANKIPPIIVRDAAKWSGLAQAMTQRRIHFSKAKPCVDGIRVNPVSVDDFRSLTRLLEERRVPFHSFALPEAKTLRAVLRTVPVEISLDDIKSDLVDQGLAPIKVTRMISGRSKLPLPLVLVEVPKDKGQIFDLRTVCHLRISVERPHKKGTTAQCHRCQRFHHSQKNCHALAKCVKCGEGHESKDCKKSKEIPARCANCGGGHTASYRGCPRFPRGYLGNKPQPGQNPNRAPAPSQASSRQQPPAAARQSAPAPKAGNKPSTGKSFADAAASKKPAPAPAPPAPRPTSAKKPAANGNALMDILLAIQSSSTKDEILGKVLALLPNLLSGC
jgi:hypothetical protein